MYHTVLLWIVRSLKIADSLFAGRAGPITQGLGPYAAFLQFKDVFVCSTGGMFMFISHRGAHPDPRDQRRGELGCRQHPGALLPPAPTSSIWAGSAAATSGACEPCCVVWLEGLLGFCDQSFFLFPFSCFLFLRSIPKPSPAKAVWGFSCAALEVVWI